ncbi:hypothetical protein [Bradyrhizobium sp. LHD-71]|uniref:hypothetical protein n=1 Tax=Bradyrhizobium sp. LHD-71 TaxID=3072141 RepID=UPI00280DA95A|nr:hypothetical protein [Bradyrhizobium sp. LHD-71]MDQ8728342.1 hypothetical protein [Bradyrhizobium sp. LHD-71]
MFISIDADARAPAFKAWQPWAIALLLILPWGIYPFIDFNPYIFEGDVGNLTTWASQFKEMLLARHANFVLVPPNAGYPPYFDGYSVLYAILSFPLNGFATDEGSMVFAFRLINAAVWTCSALTLFFSAWFLSRNALLAFSLAIIYAASPGLLSATLLRMDHLIMLMLNAMILLSLVIASRPTSTYLAATLAAVMAILIATKISSIALCVTAAPAVIIALYRRWWSIRHVLVALSVGAAVSVLLWIRYLFHLPDFFDIVFAKYLDLKAWDTLVGTSDWAYYFWTYPIKQWGSTFNVAVALASAVVVAVSARKPWLLPIAVPLIVLSLIGLFQQKYDRFAFSFFPLYLLAFAALAQLLGKWKIVAVLFPLIGLSAAIPNYIASAKEASNASASIQATRIEPKNWIRANVKPGSRVGSYASSYVTLPPIWDMPYKFVQTFFNFPYLDGPKMREYRPPSMKDIEDHYDVILLSDCHLQIYDGTFRAWDAQARALEWRGFATELFKRYRTEYFEAQSKNYCVRRIYVVVVNPDALLRAPVRVDLEFPE